MGGSWELVRCVALQTVARRFAGNTCRRCWKNMRYWCATTVRGLAWLWLRVRLLPVALLGCDPASLILYPCTLLLLAHLTLLLWCRCRRSLDDRSDGLAGPGIRLHKSVFSWSGTAVRLFRWTLLVAV
jgi:hypothetical protein